MPASSPTCHHVHPTGKRCGSPALRGEQFCFYHHPTRRPPTHTRPARTPFDVPAITDPEALQITLSEIIRRLADNTLDTKRASLLLLTLQMAKANLPAIPTYPSQESFTRAARREPHEVPDFSDLSGLLSILGLQPTPSPPGL
jgi:hypothetical protein